MKKRVLTLLLVALTLLALSGCGTKPIAQSDPVPEVPNVELRIALVLTATGDDLAWGQSMVEGLKAVQKTIGEDKIGLTISEKLDGAAEAGSAIRQYATQGYDIIFAHDSQYQSVLTEIIKDFPKTTFAYGNGYVTYPNVFAYEAQPQEGGYLLGMLAAMMTKSEIVGIVGPVESGDAEKYNYGVQQGVIAGKVTVKSRTAYTGSFKDIVGAGNMAKNQMSAGADILTGSSYQAVGALRAVAETQNNYWLSTDMDQSSIAPDHVLAAQVYNWEKVVNRIIELRKAGTLGGEHITLSLADGTIELKYNEKLAEKIPAVAKAAIEQAKQDIISGQLKVELPKE